MTKNYQPIAFKLTGNISYIVSGTYVEGEYEVVVEVVSTFNRRIETTYKLV